MLQYFMAQGVAVEQRLVLASTEDEPESMLKNLMAAVKVSPAEEETNEERMKIAWRYQMQKNPQHNSPNIDSNFILYLCRRLLF